MLIFSRKKFTDIEIVEGLRENTRQEDPILKYLYSAYFPVIKKFILSKGGNEVEAKDIFQVIIIVFYQNVKSNKFELKAKLSTYLITLAKNMWINRKNEMNKFVNLETWKEKDNTGNKIAIDHLLETERNEFALELMDELRDDCRQMLTLSIFQKLSMKKISQVMGFQNEQVARNKKSKCLKYLKKVVCRSVGLTKILNELK